MTNERQAVVWPYSVSSQTLNGETQPAPQGWAVRSLPVVVTEATYRGLDYREPTWDEVAAALSRVLPQETPLLVHLAKQAVKRRRR